MVLTVSSVVFDEAGNVCNALQLAHIHWDSHMIGWLHAIFYVGLLVSQMPCGYLVTKLPSHRSAISPHKRTKLI